MIMIILFFFAARKDKPGPDRQVRTRMTCQDRMAEEHPIEKEETEGRKGNTLCQFFLCDVCCMQPPPSPKCKLQHGSCREQQVYPSNRRDGTDTDRQPSLLAPSLQAREENCAISPGWSGSSCCCLLLFPPVHTQESETQRGERDETRRADKIK